jgi:hypothetical protein
MLGTAALGLPLLSPCDYASSNRPGSSNGRRRPSYTSRKHTEAAIRIWRDYMGMEPVEAGNIYFPPAILLALKASPGARSTGRDWRPSASWPWPTNSWPPSPAEMR